MDKEQVKVSKDIFVVVAILVVVILCLVALERCGTKPIVKTKVTYITKHDTIRIVDVKIKPVPRYIVKHDTTELTYKLPSDTTYNCLDTLVYSDTIKNPNGIVFLNEKISKNAIQERILRVDCFNTDTIIKIEKETIIRKNALVKVIPGIFAWGNPRGMWGAGINCQLLFADRYLLGGAYDIKNQGIQGNFGVKISIKKR